MCGGHGRGRGPVPTLSSGTRTQNWGESAPPPTATPSPGPFVRVQGHCGLPLRLGGGGALRFPFPRPRPSPAGRRNCAPHTSPPPPASRRRPRGGVRVRVPRISPHARRCVPARASASPCAHRRAVGVGVPVCVRVRVSGCPSRVGRRARARGQRVPLRVCERVGACRVQTAVPQPGAGSLSAAGAPRARGGFRGRSDAPACVWHWAPRPCPPALPLGSSAGDSQEGAGGGSRAGSPPRAPAPSRLPLLAHLPSARVGGGAGALRPRELPAV